MEKYTMRKLRNSETLGAMLTMLGSILFHFLYDLFPNPLIATVAAVNESVWEHTKIVTTPYLLFGIYEWFRFGRQQPAQFVKAKALGLWSVPLLMISFYYTYTGIFGTRITVVDVLSAFVWSAVAFWISYRSLKRGAPVRKPRFFVFLILLLPLLQLVFTFFPPELPLFLSAV